MKWERMERDGFVIEIEPLEDNYNFTNFDSKSGETKTVTWKEVKEQLINAILKHKDKLRELGIKRIQIGSIGYFYSIGLTRGRFISLTTMHMARLLKKKR